MTCKECFHYNICDSFAEHELREMMRVNCKEEHWCVHFINKNKVIVQPDIEQIKVQF